MYVSHLNSKVERPFEELQGFERVSLKAGEQKRVVMALSARQLSYWNEATHSFTVEHDGNSISIRVGGASDSLPLHETITP